MHLEPEREMDQSAYLPAGRQVFNAFETTKAARADLPIE
jgi:hypothetical protein